MARPAPTRPAHGASEEPLVLERAARDGDTLADVLRLQQRLPQAPST